ncbi:hypothetical protein CY34DRAFT_798692 [Suillus luteus UH-Slu-Lm8-n1]|uniref:Uncharacterized protein n=1 Tax=Suillus luteus UH-Slu-Lm8-n1 TaxID=930992 RepID=A0A0D0BZ52_9AGAM|nr:hypothetical protein CY34DRAFT_798692 [Suillus luteus UH-Slu-Lm8-n1]
MLHSTLEVCFPGSPVIGLIWGSLHINHSRTICVKRTLTSDDSSTFNWRQPTVNSVDAVQGFIHTNTLSHQRKSPDA